jgi:hypothetical protein
MMNVTEAIMTGFQALTEAVMKIKRVQREADGKQNCGYTLLTQDL